MIVWQVEVPGLQTVTLTQALLRYLMLTMGEQSEPLTVMATVFPPVTVRVVEPEISPDVAVIVVVPVATEVARPAALIVAMAGADEVQVTIEVKS